MDKQDIISTAALHLLKCLAVHLLFPKFDYQLFVVFHGENKTIIKMVSAHTD